MTNYGKSHNSPAGMSWPRRAGPWLVRAHICRMPRKASRSRRICRKPRWFGAVATSSTMRVRAASGAAVATVCRPEFCTMSAIWSAAGLVTSIWPTRNIIAPDAASVSMPTCPITHGPSHTTPIVSFHSRCDWSSRTACRTKPPAGTCGAIIEFLSLLPPSKTGWRAGGKKAARQMWASYLDWALSDFSGYIAADELYDGPFCVLSIVDNRAFKRLCYEVLDHDPTHRDVRRFFRRFRAALDGRGLALRGITTDGSELYPQPISQVFGAVKHQVCRFHILAELNKAVLRAVAQVRKQLAAQKPPLPRGRPGT